MLAPSETHTEGIQSLSDEVHSPDIANRCDGSRTSPDLQYEIMRRHKQDLCVAEISRQVGCDPRTVKAVIQNWGTAQHTLRLQAHRSQVVDNLILGMSEAAKRGKLDSILNLSHTLGITEPVKGQHQAQVAVQINLHGGPEPVSLASVSTTTPPVVVEAECVVSPAETGLDRGGSDNESNVA